MNRESQYIQTVKDVLLAELSSPSMEFIQFLANRACSSTPGQQVIDELGPIVRKAFAQLINDRLKTVVGCKELTENFLKGSDHHIISDEEFEAFFVVNVTEQDSLGEITS